MGVDIQAYRAKIGTYRHSCGTDVVTFTLVINFSQCLKSIGSVLFIGILLTMAGIEQNPGPKEFDSARQQNEEIPECSDLPNIEVTKQIETTELLEYTKPTKIKVSGLTEDIDCEILETVFENEQSICCGKVKNVTVNRKDKSAIIEFEEAKAVETVLQKRPISINGNQVEIEIHDEAVCSGDATYVTNDVELSGAGAIDSQCTSPNKIKVTGLPENVDEDILAMFFENEDEQNGGKVVDVVIGVDGKYAIVEFEETLAVQRVLEKKSIDLFGALVNIEIFSPGKVEDKAKPTKIRVTGLPKNIKSEVLKMIFESEQRQGGWKVKDIVIDNDTNTAIVDFVEAAAVEVVMQKQPIVILHKEVKIDVIDSSVQSASEVKPTKLFVTELPEKVSEETLTIFFENEKKQGGGQVLAVTIDKENQNAIVEFEDPNDPKYLKTKENTKIVVTGLPQNISTEFLVMFFENQRRYGGGPVKHAELSLDKHSAVIEFEEADGVQNVMRKQPVILQNKEVKISIFVPEPDRGKVETTKIKVSQLPEQISKEFLVMFFENEKRQGGGKVKSIEINEVKQYAVVEFEETEAVEIVLQKQPIVISGKEVIVDIFDPKYLKTKENTKIVVTGLPQNISTEFLVMFFENQRRYGGGPVKHAELSLDKHSAVIEFEEADGVQNVMRKQPVILQNKEVKISIFVPEPDREKVETTKIKVSQLPEQISKEFLVMFFENEKRQGGGKVKSIEINEVKQYAVVEFEETEAVEIVLQKQPIVISGKEVIVDIFDPKYLKTKENTKIVVTGLPQNISTEFLVMFFENQRRYGGGPVKHAELSLDKHSAVIEFEEADGVQNVMRKQPVILQNKEVKISIFVPEPDREKVETTKIKVSQLPEQISKEFLVMFFENEKRQGGGKVKSIEINEVKQYAVVEFEEAKAVETVLQKRPVIIEKKEVVVEIYYEDDEPKTILVRELPSDISEDNLREIFENERQGGGTVKAVEINSCRSQAIIEFETCESLKKVLEERTIQICLKKCNVSVFNGSKTIEVRGFQVDQVEVTNLLQYFQDTLLSGGDIVENIRMDRQRTIALVTFQKHETVKRVCTRKKHTINQTLLGVNTYIQTSTVMGFEDVYFRDQERTRKHKFKIESIQFGQILVKLGLKDKYPSKISINEVIAVSPNETIEHDKQAIPLARIPWVMLRRLMCAHSEARDITTANDDNELKQTDYDSVESFISENPDESRDISPLDIFLVVFQCCDPLLKQILFQKLYLCKMAVPFLYTTWSNTVPEPIVSVWPLRYLAIENKPKSTQGQLKNKEVDILELSSKVLVFARFGRPRYSKSKLLNSLLTSEGCKTFFNIDCPAGTTPRHLSNGQIEMFWLPLVGDKKEKFQEAMTFLNMRGDMNEHFTSETYDFISKFADAVTIVIDLFSIQKQSNELKRIVLQFSSVILIIANPLNLEDKHLIEKFQTDVKDTRNGIKLRVLCTHKGTIEQNVVDMVSDLSKHIVSQLKSNELRSIQQRLISSLGTAIKSDEDDPDSQHGKQKAEKLLKQMKSEGKPEKWKQDLTPVHCKYSKTLGKLKKKRERQKCLTEGENVDREMTEIRNKQTQAITATVRSFIDVLIDNSGSSIRLKLILGWLNFFIEREKRKVLPKLMQENRNAWEKLKNIKSCKETKPEDIEQQEKVITDLESEIDEASFSVEHLFREIGHIYEAILELDLDASQFRLPPLSKTANVIGHLVANGHQLELIDGESFYMPFIWTKHVLHYVDKFLKTSKVMVLSVLGLQSSGKSTLLNTMFGSQFSTRTGRCTRGINIQLVPAKAENYENTKSSFNYVLVVDTEGLRSPELSHVQHEHDNELATVITGLGDITMLNIMGENTSEIKDILQVIVHAFLRLKMTNRNLDMRKCCTFIHQNVTDTSASDNMITGLSKLMQTLDAMTEESAKSEGILDITTFNQVIELDISSLVWYLKNLWQGNPPMARVNTEYSERVVDMKCKVLQKALSMDDKSYKSLSDILEQAYNLWKGVLNEDFVFSFRNSLEIRVYMDMEMVVQDQLWLLETFTRERLVKNSQSQFAECDRKEILRSVADKLEREFYDLLADEKTKTERVIDSYFERNKYKDIIIQWKSTQHNRVDFLCHKLERTIKEHVDKKLMERSVEILTVTSHEKHEEELRLKSMEVANALKGSTLTDGEIANHFEEIWKSFITKIDTTSYSSDANRKPMKNIFIECLNAIFKKNHAILKQHLEKSAKLTPIQNVEKLAGSFDKTDIDCKEDLSLSMMQKGKNMFGYSDIKKYVTTLVNQILVTVDENIESLCRLNDEISELHVNKLLHDIMVNAMLSGKERYNCKPTFKVKMLIYVSRHAHIRFERHNEDYFRTQGVAVRLEQYKEQQKISFEAHLSNRASEDIVARLLSNVVESFAKEWTLANISNNITEDLHSYLPPVKNRVIIEICSNLVDKDDFDAFLRYLLYPKDYANQWILEKANKRLFDHQSGRYYEIAENLVNGVFEKAKSCLTMLTNKLINKPPPNIDIWVDEFILLSKNLQLSIPVENFRNVRKESVAVANVEYLNDAIIANMLQSKDDVVCYFRSITENTVKWKNGNPLELITKKIWGCPLKCPFCGEPCAKNEDHNGDDHYSIQHRPSCCDGVRQEITNKACLEACNFDINSTGIHRCGVFGFACNKIKSESCTVGTHSYRDYKKYLPTWDIPPSSNMHDSSKFWMWFVATYQTKLCDTFSYELEHIPSSWKEISKKQAKESLRKTYSAFGK